MARKKEEIVEKVEVEKEVEPVKKKTVKTKKSNPGVVVSIIVTFLACLLIFGLVGMFLDLMILVITTNLACSGELYGICSGDSGFQDG